MKDKMTLGLVCAFFIGLAYFGSSSIESSNIETEIISEIPPVQLESESLEIIICWNSIFYMPYINNKYLSL